MFITCKKDLIEDGILLFKQGKKYEAVEHKTIQGRSEIDQYVDISSSGKFKFENYFRINI